MTLKITVALVANILLATAPNPNIRVLGFGNVDDNSGFERQLATGKVFQGVPAPAVEFRNRYSILPAGCEQPSDPDPGTTTQQSSRPRVLAAAFRCVLRAISMALRELSTDNRPETARITLAPAVRCALGELEIAAFVRNDPSCDQLNDSVSIDVDSVLVRVYDSYIQKRSGFRKRNRDIERLLRALMEVRSLNQPLRATLRSGLFLSDVSTDGDVLFTHELERQVADWTGQFTSILWETSKLGRGTVSGELGQRSVLAAWSRTGGDGTEELVVRPVNGYFYEFFVNIHLIHRRTRLVDAFVGLGQERVARTTLSDSVLTILADNRVGAWSFREEYGIRFRIFDADLVDIEYGRRTRAPVFEYTLGLRNNQRFRSEKALAAIPDTRRLFWRLGIDLRRVLIQSQSEENGASWKFLLVSEQELDWLGGGRAIPTFTRVMLVGEKGVFPW